MAGLLPAAADLLGLIVLEIFVVELRIEVGLLAVRMELVSLDSVVIFIRCCIQIRVVSVLIVLEELAGCLRLRVGVHHARDLLGELEQVDTVLVVAAHDLFALDVAQVVHQDVLR